MRRNPEVIAKRLDNTMVLVHLPTSNIFELNETGTRIWELVCEGLDAETIVSRLIAEFDVDREQAEAQVRELVSRLHANGLIGD
jgi:hypothetical protein